MSLIKVRIDKRAKAMENQKMEVSVCLCIFPLYEGYDRIIGDKGLWVKPELTNIKSRFGYDGVGLRFKLKVIELSYKVPIERK